MRTRGNDQRIQKKMNVMKNALPRNHTTLGIQSITWLKPSQPGMCNGIQPPRKSSVAMPDTTNRFRYSAR